MERPYKIYVNGVLAFTRKTGHFALKELRTLQEKWPDKVVSITFEKNQEVTK